MPLERAIVFIDGSNFYHAANRIGVATGDLKFQSLAQKLVLDRELADIRYYVGRFRAIFRELLLRENFYANSALRE